MMHTVYVCDDGEAVPAVSADAQAWAACILAEAFLNGRNVRKAAGRVPLLVADLHDVADLFALFFSNPKATIRPPLTITAEDSLDLIEARWCFPEPSDEREGDPAAWAAAKRSRVATHLLPHRKPLYQAVVVAAAGVPEERKQRRRLAALYEEVYESSRVDLTDDEQRAAREEEVYEAQREAEAVMYEERDVEETSVL